MCMRIYAYTYIYMHRYVVVKIKCICTTHVATYITTCHKALLYSCDDVLLCLFSN